MDADAASFSTEIVSMSSGFTKFILGTSTLSTKISGAVPELALNDPTDPRSLIVDSVPIPPTLFVIVSPGVIPCRALATSVTGLLAIASCTLTFDTAPVRLTFFCAP